MDDNDQPLETSQMDENLFISEYISPIAPAERSQFFKEEKKNDSVVRSPSPTTTTTATPRQDNVVQPMTKLRVLYQTILPFPLHETRQNLI